MLFSCHFTTVSFPSEPPEQESSGARGKVGGCRGWLVDGVREVDVVGGLMEVKGGGGDGGERGGSALHALITLNMEDVLASLKTFRD